MDLAQAATLGGASVLVVILMEALKRALAWGATQVDRFGAILAIGMGVVIVVLATAAQGAITGADDTATAVIQGILAGAAASGLYDGGMTLLSGGKVQG